MRSSVYFIVVMILDGKRIAQEVAHELKNNRGAWKKKFFAAFLIGENQISENFLKRKKKFAESIGVEFRLYTFSENFSNDALRKEIGRVMRGTTCGGGIIQLPLPAHHNDQTILNAIPKEKDPDCLSEKTLGGFYTERWVVQPPSVAALQRILAAANFDIRNKKVAIAGHGRLIGKPISLWLMDRAREVAVLYIDPISGNPHLKDADLIISGVGKPEIIKEEYIKEGAGIIDFGYGFDDGKLKGDVDFERCGKKASFITPTPGGTGPVLVAELFYNFYLLNRK